LLGRIDERSARLREEAAQQVRAEIERESIEWGTKRAEEGVKLFGVGKSPSNSFDKPKP
jgi:hypothetical protein